MITEKMAETISHFAMQNEQLQKKLDVAVKALKELKPQLESEDDWLIVARALREIEEIEEIDDSFEKCDKSHFFPSENVEGLR